jgi:hypothetical protein
MHFTVRTSTIWARLPPSLSSLGKKALHSADNLGSGDLEDFGEFQDSCERRAVVRALQKAYVFRVIATFERERFLRKATLLTQFVQGLSKRSFLWRTIFSPSRHLHAGVCDVSMNTSTKYSIQ